MITFGPDYALHRHLLARTPATSSTSNMVARRDLSRWYEALADAMLGIKLGPAEVLLLVEAAERTPDRNALVASLPEVLETGDAPGYGHVRPGLLEAARGWDRMQRWAVVDACERYILLEEAGGRTTAEILHDIGLNPYGTQA